MLSLIVGLAGSAAIITSALMTTRSKMLLWSVIALVLFATQFGLVGAYVALMTASISAVRNFTGLLSLKYKFLGHWGFMLGFLGLIIVGWFITNDFSNFLLVNLIPLLANIINSVAVFLKDIRISKVLFLVSGSMWLYFQFSFGAYGLMVGEVFTMIANISALVVLLRENKAVPQSA